MERTLEEAFKEQIQNNIAQWKQQRDGLILERRTKDRLLRVAEKREMRAGKVRGAYNQGQEIDWNAVAVNQFRYRLGQIDLELETLEVSIEEAEAELGNANNERRGKPRRKTAANPAGHATDQGAQSPEN